ncbi:DHHA1 domain-containing protein [Ruminococcaceae bacterium YRB3002]|nr:DHHA1 domain-containing protein [Ruminococcaceae bacterium YRB3002]
MNTLNDRPDVRELIEICKGHKVYIQTHNIPDPDAIGSAFGLQQLLLEFGIKSTICYDGEIDKFSASKMLDLFGIEMFPDEELVDEMREEDYIICVDSQKKAGNITDLKGNEIAAVDHHPTMYVSENVEYMYKDIRLLGACCTIITEYYRDLSITPSQDVATALLYGIKMDTLQFSRGVTEEDIMIFAYLNPLMDADKIKVLEMNSIEYDDLKAYGAAIRNIQVFSYLGITYIPFDCPDAMVAIVADFILSLIEVEVSVVYCERPDGLKFSVRSERNDVNAGELTAKALEGIGNGGGHASMAGGRIAQNVVDELGEFRNNVLTERFIRALGLKF